VNIIEAFLLGALQGLTEFLPVSSSGHLVLGETFLGLTISPADLQGFDILLHFATALALLLVYRKSWQAIALSPFTNDKKNQRLLAFLIVATIPGAIAGILFQDTIAENFRSVTTVALGLFITGIVLLAAHKSKGKGEIQNMKKLTVISMGLAQACALVPGLSRSGLSISAGQITGLNRREALDFSFMMAMPIILGAFAMTSVDLVKGEILLPSLAVSFTGFATSFFASLFAVIFLRRFVAQNSLAWFTLYLLPISIYILLWY